MHFMGYMGQVIGCSSKLLRKIEYKFLWSRSPLQKRTSENLELTLWYLEPKATMIGKFGLCTAPMADESPEVSSTAKGKGKGKAKGKGKVGGKGSYLAPKSPTASGSIKGSNTGRQDSKSKITKHLM